MAKHLDYPVGDLDKGQIVQLSQSLAFIPVKEPVVVWDAHEVLTVSSTALALTKNLAENATVVLISMEDSQSRYFVHGAVPTTTPGHLLSSGDIIKLRGRAEIDQFRIIRVSVDAKALCSYGREVMP